ncbi:pentapeptide repeat-containing protein [Streptomyces sp. NPDC055886]
MRLQIARRPERRGLRLWNVGIVLALAFAAALLVAGFVFNTGWDLLGARELKKQPKIDSKTLFDLVKLSFGVVAGAGALVALVVAYRRQRVDEDGALRDATRLHTERFTAAVSQLGDESAAVRLGGVHALVGLADDAPTRDLRQTCIDVLCAYLRLPYTAKSALPAGDPEALHTYLALREVRHTIIRLIRDHLRNPADHPNSWQGHDLDFTGAVFDGGDLSGAVFSGGTVNFADTTFSSGTFRFLNSIFRGGTVNFTGAIFADGTIGFNNATFDGAEVNFLRTEYTGATIAFNEATFNDGTVAFNNSAFRGGTVNFVRTKFLGGTVNFRASTLDRGTINFTDARLSGGCVRFTSMAVLDGNFRFKRAKFEDGTVTFKGSSFRGGAVTFSRAVFTGSTVVFNSTTFAGGAVTFAQATGNAPVGLPGVGSGAPTPTGLVLAAGW